MMDLSQAQVDSRGPSAKISTQYWGSLLLVLELLGNSHVPTRLVGSELDSWKPCGREQV